jgi:poly(A) polymerase
LSHHIPHPSHNLSSSYDDASFQIIARSEHGISRQQISPYCLKVLYKLGDAGFDAFIVGGGVRDLLLGLKPKDFDIATNATPQQIKAIFRNSRIIGRRFRIVHVIFGHEIIEVSTFRGTSQDTATIVSERMTAESRHEDAVQSTNGMILRDNVWGSIKEDVLRRDFTVNALYYTVNNFEIHDYLNGLADIDLRILRMIGDAEQRYREDPVRLLRAIRLAVKLNFKLAKETEEPIASCTKLLESVSPARLFDEFIKLFFSGHSLKTLKKLQEHGIFKILFPVTERAMSGFDNIRNERYQVLLELACASTDLRLGQGKSITPAFLLAVILWPAVDNQRQALLTQGVTAAKALQVAGNQVINEQLTILSIPKRFSMPIREIWETSQKLAIRSGRRAASLIKEKRFRAAYDFVLLREESGEDLQKLGAWWTAYQNGDDHAREELLAQLPRSAKPSSHRRSSVKSHIN